MEYESRWFWGDYSAQRGERSDYSAELEEEKPCKTAEELIIASTDKDNYVNEVLCLCYKSALLH